MNFSRLIFSEKLHIISRGISGFGLKARESLSSGFRRSRKRLTEVNFDKLLGVSELRVILSIATSSNRLPRGHLQLADASFGAAN